MRKRATDTNITRHIFRPGDKVKVRGHEAVATVESYLHYTHHAVRLDREINGFRFWFEQELVVVERRRA